MSPGGNLYPEMAAVISGIPIKWNHGFNKKPWKETWDKIEGFDHNGVFLAKLNEKYIGFVISFQKADIGYISVLTILPLCRGNSYAVTLIYQAVNYLRSRGLDTITIRAEEDNIAALNLYKKIGFSDTELSRIKS